jgi:hypothetical protein
MSILKKAWMLALLLFVLQSHGAIGQKDAIFDKEQTIQEAKKQLEAMSSEGGDLYNFCKEKNLTGEFVVDITLQLKGKVLTVFMVSSSVEEIKHQNLLKSRLTEIQFENIKIPKNERVKFRQTFTF